VRELGRLETTADALEKEFGQLWLRHNRVEGLAENMERMARQGVMLRKLGELARRGALKTDESFSRMQALNGPEVIEVGGSRR
jgi:hypothetical protein